MADQFGEGIAVEKIELHPSDLVNINAHEKGNLAHRHDGHSFFLLESGTVQIQIDFEAYTITPWSIIYIHPDQVHRTESSESITVSSLVITDENLNVEYLKLLDDISPAKPLKLTKEVFSVLSESSSLCIKFSERKTDRLYHSLLKDSCNALVALILSQYLAVAKGTDKLSRFEVVTRAFRKILEHDYCTSKRPADYAEKLHISTPYLNECVKNTTGFSVSYHIQQRVVLEAKRLLYHSNRSVKEIAADLGYDDHPYFSRLFNKVAGMSALAFRNKNRD